MATRPSAQDILETMQGYQRACVLAAGAELDLFTLLRAGPRSAEQLAKKLSADLRGLAILLDALVATGTVNKHSGKYALPAGLDRWLSEDNPRNVLGMLRHQANCMRRWAQLAEVVSRGVAARRDASIRGAEGDRESFIRAMNEVSRDQAPKLVRKLKLAGVKFTHLLDIGGGPGTWTIAMLKMAPGARATLFDLPPVIPMARRNIEEAGLAGRVELVGGDFYTDDLPAGADLAWLGAIVHQNSRRQNRALLAKAFAALAPNGRVVIRDIVMDNSRTRPAGGAMFAVNMLVNTPAGGTFTFRELREDLASAGFAAIRLLHAGQGMDSLVGAVKKEIHRGERREN